MSNVSTPAAPATSPAPAPGTFAELLWNIETRLKGGDHFELLGRPHTPPEFCAMVSLTLKEVYFQEKGARGVTFLVEGAFQGRNPPHSFRASPQLKAELGLADVTFALGGSDGSDGIVLTGMTITIAKDWLIELERNRKIPGAVVVAPRKPTKALKQSKRYIELAAEKSYLDKEIARLCRARDATQAKLAHMADKADAVSVR